MPATQPLWIQDFFLRPRHDEIHRCAGDPERASAAQRHALQCRTVNHVVLANVQHMAYPPNVQHLLLGCNRLPLPSPPPAFFSPTPVGTTAFTNRGPLRLNGGTLCERENFRPPMDSSPRPFAFRDRLSLWKAGAVSLIEIVVCAPSVSEAFSLVLGVFSVGSSGVGRGDFSLLAEAKCPSKGCEAALCRMRRPFLFEIIAGEGAAAWLARGSRAANPPPPQFRWGFGRGLGPGRRSCERPPHLRTGTPAWFPEPKTASSRSSYGGKNGGAPYNI
eukprot:gene7669-5378_t